MMRTQAVAVNPAEPTGLTADHVNIGNRPRPDWRYEIAWQDNSVNETAFVIERRLAGSTDAWEPIAMVQTEDRVNLTTLPAGGTQTGAATGTATYTDVIGRPETEYEYQVYAINTVGDTWDYSNPAFNEIPPGGGFPTITVTSRDSGPFAGDPVDAPTNLAGTLTVKNKKTSTVNLSWTDNSANETGFLIQRTNSDGTNVVNATVGAGVSTFTQTVTSGVAYIYRVHAFNATTQSSWSNSLPLP